MNPYKVLNINHDATPRDIVQAAAKALRKKEYSARDVAEAGKKLMDPKVRLILDFVYSVDLDPLLYDSKINDINGSVARMEKADELKRLTIFDNQA